MEVEKYTLVLLKQYKRWEDINQYIYIFLLLLFSPNPLSVWSCWVGRCNLQTHRSCWQLVKQFGNLHWPDVRGMDGPICTLGISPSVPHNIMNTVAHLLGSAAKAVTFCMCSHFLTHYNLDV